MYNLPYFKEQDSSVVRAFMHQHPFVILCGSENSGRPVATHVPVLIKEENGKMFLRGHIMRNTAHHKAFASNPQALAMFNGPHTYVSASWYENPLQGSTWNYMTVHAHGSISFLPEEMLIDVLRETTALFENNSQSPSLYDNLPQEYVDKLVKAIVAFDLEIQEIDNVFKLSQNRDEKSFHNIIDRLSKGSADAQQIAEEMKARASQLYNVNEG